MKSSFSPLLFKVFSKLLSWNSLKVFVKNLRNIYSFNTFTEYDRFYLVLIPAFCLFAEEVCCFDNLRFEASQIPKIHSGKFIISLNLIFYASVE
jgi:hypothetical protein